MRAGITILFTFLIFFAGAQGSVGKRLLSEFLKRSRPEATVKRKFLTAKNEEGQIKINPFYYLGGGVLFVYQRVFSEQIQANCKYLLSCSNYAKKSIERKGIFLGVLLGINQMSCCFDGVEEDYSQISYTENGKIDNLDDQ